MIKIANRPRDVLYPLKRIVQLQNGAEVSTSNVYEIIGDEKDAIAAIDKFNKVICLEGRYSGEGKYSQNGERYYYFILDGGNYSVQFHY